MVFDHKFGHNLLADLKYQMLPNFMVQPKEMQILVSVLEWKKQSCKNGVTSSLHV